jgi:signal transduction histidine kinase
MVDMEKKTHYFLTMLLYITFFCGYSIILLLNDNPAKPLTIFTIILLLTTYSHKKYYRHNHVDEKGKIFLAVNLLLTYVLLYFDYSNYEQLFILLLLGDCILGYDLKYSVKYIFIIHITYYPYAYFVLYQRPVGEYAGDLLRDFVIISFVVIILYIAKYQINEKAKYNEIIKQRDSALAKIKEMTLNEERSRIAFILHNSLGHMLVSTNMSLQAEKMELISKGKVDKNAFVQTEKQIGEAMSLLRKTIENQDDLLLGIPLDKLLTMFLNEVLNNTKIKINYKKTGIEWITEDNKNLVYNIILETVTNSLKHSNCSKIDILLQASQKEIKIRITDNGQGFDDLKIGFGISKIKEKVLECNGTYHITSDHNCRVEVYLPLKVN